MERQSPITGEERQIIIRCQKGDKLAFEQLYKRYSSDVYSMAIRMTGSEDIAEEVTQESFISIYKYINRFQFQSAFTTWIYRIVMRRTADYFRKTKKHSGKTISLFQTNKNESFVIDVADPDPDPAKKADQNERVKSIENAILKLKDKQKTILILRYVNQLQYEEIAEILGCRVGTVKSRLNRAHRSLEEALSNIELKSMD